MKWMLVPILVLSICAANGQDARAEKTARRPNIVMVLIDDMGWGDFSCFGNKEVKTPAFDRMASEGIRFEQFYVNMSICSPSRCAVLTGQYPHRWRITSYLDNRAENERRGIAQWLDPKAPSISRFLHQAGYATGHFGKWHLGGQRDVDNAPEITAYGYDQSLTNFEGMGPKLLPLTLKPGDTKPGRIWQDAERLGKPVTWMQRSKITSGYIDAAIPFIDAAVKADKPFYVDIWPDDVHSPFWPPVDRWANGKHGLYLSVLVEMDRQFERLFDHIRHSPALRDNTIVVICSDNGPEPGAGTTGGLRGVKGSLFEGGIRSPLVVWAPGWIDASKNGSVNNQSVFAAFDLGPSFLKLAGVAPAADAGLDGEDLSETLLGRSSTSRKAPVFWRRPPDRKLLGDAPRPQPDLAVREGKWKLLCEYDGSMPRLFDLTSDRGEKTNVAARHPDLVSRLGGMVLQWNQSMPADNGPKLGKQALRRKAAASNDG